MSEPTLLIVGPPNGKERRRRGRPPRAGESSKRRFEFVTTDDEATGIKHVAAAEGRTVSEIIRDAVNEYVGDFSERKIFPKT